jgi:hypothetical protein
VWRLLWLYYDRKSEKLKEGFFMRTSSILLTAIMAGIYSGILDGFEESNGLAPFASVFILIFLTFITALLFKRILPK